MRSIAFAVVAGAMLVGVAFPAFAEEKPVAGETRESSLKGDTLTFASWGGILQDGQIAALQEFVAKSGVELLSDPSFELAKVQSQVESKNIQWDVVHTSEYDPYTYCGTLFQKIDLTVVDVSKLPGGDYTDCGVPALYYGTVNMYNVEKYGDNPPQNWADFFNVEKFPGVRAIIGTSAPSGALIEVVLLADGVKKEDMFPEDAGPMIDRALNKLRANKNSFIFSSSGAQQQQMMESGEADMVMAWTGRAMTAVKNGANYKAVWSDWIVNKDYLSIPVGVKNPAAANALLNAYIGKHAQEIFAEKTSYSPVNTEAKPKLDGATAEFVTNTPERLKQGYEQNIQYWVKNYAILNKKWAEYISGY